MAFLFEMFDTDHSGAPSAHLPNCGCGSLVSHAPCPLSTGGIDVDELFVAMRNLEKASAAKRDTETAEYAADRRRNTST